MRGMEILIQNIEKVEELFEQASDKYINALTQLASFRSQRRQLAVSWVEQVSSVPVKSFVEAFDRTDQQVIEANEKYLQFTKSNMFGKFSQLVNK